MRDWRRVLKESTELSLIEESKEFKQFLEENEFINKDGRKITVIEIKQGEYEIEIENKEQWYIENYTLHDWQNHNDMRLKIVTGEIPNPNEHLMIALEMFFKKS